MQHIAKSSQPLVSVGMPVYNGAATIVEAIESILGQTYENIELIISDNASSDQTSEICSGYAQHDARVRYIRQETNIGAYQNFKFCLEQARGSYFMWASADDYRSPDCVAFYVERIGTAGGFFSTYAVFDRVTDKVDVMSIPMLSSDQSKPSAVRAFLAMHRTAMIYGLFKTSVATECFGDHFFDWFDSCFLLRVIHRHGMNTAGGPPRFFYGYEGRYKVKPVSGRFIRMWPYFKETAHIVLGCGPMTYLQYANRFRVSAQINVKLMLNALPIRPFWRRPEL